MRTRHETARLFLMVYLVTAICAIVDIALIAQMPQGFQLTVGLCRDVVAFSVLGAIGLRLVATNAQSRLGAMALALGSIVALRELNMIAHLAPAYIGRERTLIDQNLMSFDRAFNFDWLAYFYWHADHPMIAQVCSWCSIAWPFVAIALVLLLSFFSQTRRLCRFLVAMNISLLIVYGFSIFFPAYGAYQQHGLNPTLHEGFQVRFSDFKPTYDALRAGIVDIYADTIPSGAISFPSFHTTTVVLYVWAAWPTPARWMILVIQMLSFLAIPVQGADFLSDMIGGGGIGIVAIIVSNRLIPVEWPRRDLPRVTAAPDSRARAWPRWVFPITRAASTRAKTSAPA